MAVFICRQDAMLLSDFAAKLFGCIPVFLELRHIKAYGVFKMASALNKWSLKQREERKML
jgi:hypothetical protein